VFILAEKRRRLPIGEINVVFGPNGAIPEDVPQLDPVVSKHLSYEQTTVAVARVRFAA
jgi:hypothetical protein